MKVKQLTGPNTIIQICGRETRKKKKKKNEDFPKGKD